MQEGRRKEARASAAEQPAGHNDHDAIERELYGEIVRIKTERLVQVTRCTATQTIKSVYCGFQSRSGPERYAKFHDPIVIEPADCRMAVGWSRNYETS